MQNDLEGDSPPQDKNKRQEIYNFKYRCAWILASCRMFRGPNGLKEVMFHRILFSLFLIFLFACDGENKPVQETQVGQAAPLFTLKDLQGNPLSLDSRKGKIVLLRFWSTRCKSCKEEMPKLETIFQNLRPSGMILIAVNIEDPPEKVQKFIKGMGLTYTILIDEKKRVAKQYQVFGVPTSFIIDKDGIIRERFFGDLSEEETEKLVKPLL